MGKLLYVGGHGLLRSGVMDNGATGNGYKEAERVRALGERVRVLGGSNVLIGNPSKKWIDNGLWNTVDKNSFTWAVESHLDSTSNASAKGGHVIVHSRFTPDIYDNNVANAVSKRFPGRSERITRSDKLGFLNSCANRGINARLVENCFISNAADIKKFNAELDSIAGDLLSSFGLGSSKPTPTPAPTTYNVYRYLRSSTNAFGGGNTQRFYMGKRAKGYKFKNYANNGYVTIKGDRAVEGARICTYNDLGDDATKQLFVLEAVINETFKVNVGYRIVPIMNGNLCFGLDASGNVVLLDKRDTSQTNRIIFFKNIPNETTLFQMLNAYSTQPMEIGDYVV